MFSCKRLCIDRASPQYFHIFRNDFQTFALFPAKLFSNFTSDRRLSIASSLIARRSRCRRFNGAFRERGTPRTFFGCQQWWQRPWIKPFHKETKWKCSPGSAQVHVHPVQNVCLCVSWPKRHPGSGRILFHLTCQSSLSELLLNHSRFQRLATLTFLKTFFH